MAFYENVFIVRQDVSGQQVEELTNRFSEILQSGGGKVERTEFWGLRTMTFKIKKNRKGHYVMLNIESPPAAVHEMERNMRLSEDVIRYMTLKVDELEEGPSAMMKNRAERSERSRSYGDRSDGDSDDSSSGGSRERSRESGDRPRESSGASREGDNR